ncbi:hypothetical protein LWC33_33280 [Pseudonocardia sp. RS11V-5]|uniref:hypothetical protein n=1 Tax=Pseudonocardia terrae TaxID=2905831 RepID=UPI001E3041FE|nr:hypothetical protein [Pseudonocardia terrae]MCE3556302.1 hypothetical protein [Pseudonocardia terrae]
MRVRSGVLVLLAVLLAACADVPAADRTLTLRTALGDRTALVHHPATAGPGRRWSSSCTVPAGPRPACAN